MARVKASKEIFEFAAEAPEGALQPSAFTSRPQRGYTVSWSLPPSGRIPSFPFRGSR
jgi:hypothetical protein